jgi:hypothetical protein
MGSSINRQIKQRLSHDRQISLERDRQWGGIAGIKKKINFYASCEPAIAQDH